MKPGTKLKAVSGSRLLPGHCTKMLGHSKAHEIKAVDVVTDGHMKAQENYPSLLCKNVYHHLSHIFFFSAFYRRRMIWVLPHDQALGDVCKTPLFLH